MYIFKTCSHYSYHVFNNSCRINFIGGNATIIRLFSDRPFFYIQVSNLSYKKVIAQDNLMLNILKRIINAIFYAI